MDKMFDMAFECEITKPGDSSPMQLYLADTSTSVETNVIEFWDTPGESFVYEWSCPMSSMENWAAANGSSVQEAIRVMVRINANLRDVGGWAVDVSTPAMVRSITLLSGDANLDDKVDVGDLGSWPPTMVGPALDPGRFQQRRQGRCGDLGILAANYGTNAAVRTTTPIMRRSSARWRTTPMIRRKMRAFRRCSGLGLR